MTTLISWNFDKSTVVYDVIFILVINERDEVRTSDTYYNYNGQVKSVDIIAKYKGYSRVFSDPIHKSFPTGECSPPCSGNSDTCVDGKCYCGSNPPCSGETDTCVDGKCYCGTGDPCTGQCVSGKCQCNSGEYACCYNSSHPYGQQYCCSTDNKCDSSGWEIHSCYSNSGSCWGPCSPNIGECQDISGWGS